MSSNRATEKKSDNVARGLKAAIHNDNVSGDAKESAAQRLQDLGKEVPADFTGKEDEQWEYGDPNDKHETNRVLGGYKATLTNPNTSLEAKQNAEEVLRDAYNHD
ncbi:hypothetical protein CPB84DRAFT_1743707 [Gymnopilus junonius]|uniref:Conidiation-specific protein 6 n=1 Tax=Gymnopilus junonius TaxID=109634 RepID=A0A9P5NYE8_GYMJU|nr:hypothetical protein CPB84DRAFT_1743707 [Gymnopilus junonius]